MFESRENGNKCDMEIRHNNLQFHYEIFSVTGHDRGT